MYIPEHEVRSVLTYDALIPAIRQALIDYSAGKVVQPARTVIRAGNAEDHRNGWFAVMPVIAGDVMAVKTVTFYPANAELGLPTHMAIVELLNRATGQPLAVMDGRLITEMRTAAVSAVVLDALARPNVTSLGILGSGVQARAHLQALRLVRPSLRKSASGAARKPTPRPSLLKPGPPATGLRRWGGKQARGLSPLKKLPRPTWFSRLPPHPRLFLKAAGSSAMRWSSPWAQSARIFANSTTKPCSQAASSPRRAAQSKASPATFASLALAFTPR